MGIGQLYSPVGCWYAPVMGVLSSTERVAMVDMSGRTGGDGFGSLDCESSRGKREGMGTWTLDETRRRAFVERATRMSNACVARSGRSRLSLHGPVEHCDVTDPDSKRGQNRVVQVVESDSGGRDSRRTHSNPAMSQVHAPFRASGCFISSLSHSTPKCPT